VRKANPHQAAPEYPMRVIRFVRPPLYPKQFEAMYDPRRIVCIEASTKSGKTVSGMTWLYEQALKHGPGTQVWWVAPVYRQAMIAFNRYQHFALRSQLEVFKGEHAIRVISGCKIVHLSGEDPDNLYGDDVMAVVLDEASRIKEEAWHAVRSTLTATQGPARLIGNVRGRKNFFYKLCRRAEAGEEGLGWHRITATDAAEAGIFPKEEIEAARSILPEHAFRELFEAVAAEDAANPFDAQAITDCTMPADWVGSGPVAAWGWDYAKSVDWTVGVGLNRHGEVAAFRRFQRDWEHTFEETKRLVERTPALIDQSSAGNPLLERLHRAGLRQVEGYTFTAPSKQVLMEGLAMEIQGRKLKFPDGPIRLELDAFEYSYTPRGNVLYSAPSGMHDDCVVALALAVHHLRNRPSRPLISPGGVEGLTNPYPR